MQAVIFDFDGLILDTETPDFKSIAQLYRTYGQEYRLEDWISILGGTGESDFNPIQHLRDISGTSDSVEELIQQYQFIRDELLLKNPLLPGVEAYLNDLSSLGLKAAIASSSDANWVLGHLDRLGIRRYFDIIRTSDDVERTKPAPDLFLSALSGLGVEKDKVFILEDSPNGVRAARAAGIFCVAVPNAMIPAEYYPELDFKLGSLAEKSLKDLCEKIEAIK